MWAGLGVSCSVVLLPVGGAALCVGLADKCHLARDSLDQNRGLKIDTRVMRRSMGISIHMFVGRSAPSGGSVYSSSNLQHILVIAC